MARVLVVGSINVDVVVSVTRLPAAGETLHGTSVAHLPGGKGANQAVALARLGLEVALVGAVGPDASLEDLTDEGVDVSAVARVAAPTGLALITVEDSGENTIVVVAGANALVQAPLSVDADAVVLQLEIPLQVVAATVLAARAAGALVVLNAAPALEVPAQVLRDVDVLVVNATEALLMAGAREPVEAARVLRPLVRQGVVVTLGASGCLVLGDGLVSVPGVPAVAVDAVGAGDAFVGALTCGLLEGLGLAEAAALACRAGALAVAVRGARSAPSREALA